jgi:hypothetical protein
MKINNPLTSYKIWFISFFSFFLMPLSPVSADWINLTGAQSAPNIAELHVEKTHVLLKLEIYVEDLKHFVDLLPDDFFERTDVSPPPVEERMQRFSTEGIQIVADEKEHLQAELKLVETRLRQERPNPFAGSINPLTGMPVPGPPKDKRVLYVELIYPFQNRPDRLTIVPPLTPEGTPVVSIGFLAYHESVPVVDYRFLPDRANMHLDWEDPWYSTFDNKALKRWQQSGLRMFLYVEPYEVRHEVLVRVKDMRNWIDLGLRGDEYIEVDEINPLKKRIGDFLLQHSNVRIDDKKLQPILDRTSFVKYTQTRIFFVEQPERMLINTAMLGVIITYLTDELPREVSVDWDLFADKIQRIPTSAVDPAGPFPSYVTPDDNILTWTNFLKNYQPPTVAELTVEKSLTHFKLPAMSVLCVVLLLPVVIVLRRRKRLGKPRGLPIGVGAVLVIGTILLYPFFNVLVTRPSIITPELSNDKAVVILEDLLGNIYRSFDFREEADIYDRLATSVHGDLLTDIYLQNRKSLVVTQAGGARARVKEIDIREVAVGPVAGKPLALLFHAKWTATGTVGHWGHIHTRQNQYDANITAEPVEGAWKIVDLELLEEKRIDQYAGVEQKPKVK